MPKICPLRRKLYAWALTIQLWPSRLEIYDQITLWGYTGLDLLQYLLIIYTEAWGAMEFAVWITKSDLQKPLGGLIQMPTLKACSTKDLFIYRAWIFWSHCYSSRQHIWVTTSKNNNITSYIKRRGNIHSEDTKWTSKSVSYMTHILKILIKKWSKDTKCTKPLKKIYILVLMKNFKYCVKDSIKKIKSKSQTGIKYFRILSVTKDLYPEKTILKTPQYTK